MRLRSLIPVLLTGAALGGCVTVFPKAEPSALYTLAITPPSPPAAGRPKLVVLRLPTVFPREASNDQIMTVSGSQVAAIADARWSAPAQTLFDEQTAVAFDGSASVRMISRAAQTAPDEMLRIEVRTFEARYGEPPAVPKSKNAKAAVDARPAPTVVVELKATVTYPANPGAVAERSFKAETPADANRVSAIVAAYDGASTKALGDLVAWVSGLTPPPKPAPPPASPR